MISLAIRPCYRLSVYRVPPFIRSFVRTDHVTTISHVNGLSNLDETYRQYSLAPTDELVRFWCQKSKVEVTASRRVGESIHVDAGASKSTGFSSAL